MLRSVAAVVAGLVCFQSVAFAAEKHVCRYTGRLLEPCRCPGEAPAAAGIEKSSCCDTLSARLPGIPEARISVAAEVGPAIVPCVDVAWSAQPAPASEVREVEAAGQGPPRLYLTLQQLLL